MSKKNHSNYKVSPEGVISIDTKNVRLSTKGTFAKIRRSGKKNTAKAVPA